MAKLRARGLLPTLSVVITAFAVTFQSVTTSARAGVADSAAATEPDSKIAAGALKIGFMGRPCVMSTRAGVCAGGQHEAAPLMCSRRVRDLAWRIVCIGSDRS